MALMPTSYTIYLHFSSLFGPQDVSKYEIRCQLEQGITFQGCTLHCFFLILEWRSQTKALAFLYCGEIVKTLFTLKQL